MGYFTINLANNRVGHVRWGKVRKLELPFRWLLRKNRDEKTGYIIKVNPPIGNQSEYRLFKTKDGKWFQDADEKTPLEGETAVAIKLAIEQRVNMTT